MQNSFIESNKT